MSARVSMISLGCAKNQIDAEHLLADIGNGGFELQGDVSQSDIVIVNTCGFIQSAKEEAIENILELAKLKDEGTIRKIVVTGCLAERYNTEILDEMPEVDAVFGIGANKDIVPLLKRVLKGERFTEKGNKKDLPLEGERVLTTLPYYSYIKIAEGCNNCCSYCSIPQIRGGFRSRPIETIVDEAKLLASTGVTELIVVAQDTTRYGEDIYGEYSLARLLRELCKIDGLKWIRTLYCYPDKITDELLDTIKAEKKLVKYLDIPIQHCNGDILKKMNRPQNNEELLSLFEKIRAKIPEITLRTTVIVGFPGETEENFTELCEFIDKIRFERLGCFRYSAEEGTAAAKMDNQIDDEVKEKREEIIMTKQQRIMESCNQEKLGKSIEVIVEGYDRYGECYYGRSAADAPEIDGKVFFTTAQKHVMGDYINVRIDEVMDYDLMGEEI